MKPYLRVVYNFIKLRAHMIKLEIKLNISKIELFSVKTKFIFKKNSNINLGTNIVTDGRCVIVVDSDAKLFIGNHVYMNENAMISCKGEITIGDNCKFGPNVNIFDNNHRFSIETGVSNKHRVGKIHIGTGCWLGANVVILKGADIGDNCLIGAGCIISGEIPANSIVTQKRKLDIQPLRK